MSKSAAASNGQALWNKVPKVNAELFALTYGALVTEVIRDNDENLSAVNEQLEKIGYSIGIRCVDEFLAKSNAPYCKSLAETVDVLGKTAFKMFLVRISQNTINMSETNTLSGYHEGKPSQDEGSWPYDISSPQTRATMARIYRDGC